MSAPPDQDTTPARLRLGIVLGVEEETCNVVDRGHTTSVGFATHFPSPRTERVSPGHLVAVTRTPQGTEVVVWRWYDAVVLGHEQDQVRLWEPAHGTVVARPRDARHYPAGTRAYLSAGLPGADWWVAGAAVTGDEDAEVELDEVERFYTERDLWTRLG